MKTQKQELSQLKKLMKKYFNEIDDIKREIQEERDGPGWLDRVLKENDKEVEKWPKWKKQIAKREMLRSYGEQ